MGGMVDSTLPPDSLFSEQLRYRGAEYGSQVHVGSA